MACGCGTSVFYRLLNGYDVYGIDPEQWKRDFIDMKINEPGFPVEWKEKFYKGVGEQLLQR
ncbi:hypothetical protein CLPUN_21210 [Clostridium puniceum]|uniref:Uncharacterized protein n=1 Tax=Clostridium puniceum TaxID=29367 RepID=A0A1S8TJJ7_9CLOT|nr:hypothetical protein [Clostridium puniceum]OOM77948.1 hypothetical protein CLPUN_21210 [Clostridium puniceum]